MNPPKFNITSFNDLCGTLPDECRNGVKIPILNNGFYLDQRREFESQMKRFC
jgi:hypothetical protein